MTKHPRLTNEEVEPLSRAIIELEDAVEARSRAYHLRDDELIELDWQAEDARVQKAHTTLIEAAVDAATKMAVAILRVRASARQSSVFNDPI
jgi:hypothetical protein